MTFVPRKHTGLFVLALLGCGHATTRIEPVQQVDTPQPTTAQDRQVGRAPQFESITLPTPLCSYRAEVATWFRIGFDADSFVQTDDGNEGFTALCVPQEEYGAVDIVLPREAMEVGLWVRCESPTVSFVGALPRAELGGLLRLSRPVLFGGVIAAEAYLSPDIVGVAEGGPVIRAPRLASFTPSVSMDERVGCDALTAKSAPTEGAPRQAFATPLPRRGVAFVHDGSIPVSAVLGGPMVGTLEISASSDREAGLLEEGPRQVRIAFHDLTDATLFVWVPRSVVRLLQRDPQVTQGGYGGGGGCGSTWGGGRQTVTCEHSLPLLARFGTATRQIGELHAGTPIYVIGETSDHLLQFSVSDASSLQHENMLLTTRCD